jgi:hypothetical protein
MNDKQLILALHVFSPSPLEPGMLEDQKLP